MNPALYMEPSKATQMQDPSLNAGGHWLRTSRPAGSSRICLDDPSSAKLTAVLWLRGDGRAVVFCCRNLLDEGKATIPCLAERLTTELIAHICVSTRSRPISGWGGGVGILKGKAAPWQQLMRAHGPPGDAVSKQAQVQWVWRVEVSASRGRLPGDRTSSGIPIHRLHLAFSKIKIF